MSKQRYFTPSEANRTLPLVKRIVHDITTGQTLHEHAERLGAEAHQEHPQLKPLLKQLDHLFHELEELGCSYRDWSFAVGLVDFPARLNGQDVLLCWRSDEAELGHYHPLQGGYAARQPLPEPWPSEAS